MTAGRRFLFLQGPPGPFFSELAKGLAVQNHHCLRVNLNGGDWLDWRRASIRYAGSLADWPSFLEALVVREDVTDIVLFGDCRPHHAEARRVAERRELLLHVFEEGYIRPDWITLERGGVNGHSSLPRDSQAYMALSTALPPLPPFPPIMAHFRERAAATLAYYAAASLAAPWFPGYRSHRPHAAIAELTGWCAKVALQPVTRLRAVISAGRLRAGAWFLLPLQLDSDHQIRTHSPFANMIEAIEAILASFAAHAPADTRLVVKAHPLDNGLRRWRGEVRRIAERHGVGDRVAFLDHGDIEALVAAAHGLVTVNSTTGTLAVAQGTPVAVLGTAVYDLPGVTHQGDLADFWSNPGKPQREIYDAFRRVLVTRCLVRGGFNSRAARAESVPAAVYRLGAAIGPAAGAGMIAERAIA